MSIGFSAHVKDLTGQKFGRLTVVGFSHITKGRSYWSCDCDCGSTKTVMGKNLSNGYCKSCGCLLKESTAINTKKRHMQGKHLYFIRCDEYVKIGRSSNVNQRLLDIKCMNPLPVSLIATVQNEGHLEYEVHSKFKDFHQHGEWFRLSDKQIREFLHDTN